MALDDLGVRRDVFLDLQDDAIAGAYVIDNSIQQFKDILDNHGLGASFQLSRTLEHIRNLGLDLMDTTLHFDTPFLHQIRQVCKKDILRDIKHKARIPVPDAYVLVGVADEGPAYIAAGEENIFTLPENCIFGTDQTQTQLFHL